MYGKVFSACVQGIEGQLIEVEVDISNGLPFMAIVGLPDSAVRESIERVRAAVKNCGFDFPTQRITVNLAPADVRKEGASFDLAIALGILLTSGQIKPEAMKGRIVIGELALDGTIRPVPGVLAMVHHAKKKGFDGVILPVENTEEARLITQVETIGVRRLTDFAEADARMGASILPSNNEGDHKTPLEVRNGISEPADDPGDYADVRGQHHAKRALMIAAAGLHNLLLIGPPGTGKTMLARRLPTILPELDQEEALEVTKIYSVSGKLSDRGQYIRKRPFRSPHHTISSVGLIGGGSIPKPGEVSLANRGVLYLDELPEFSRASLEALRQPLEDRKVTIARAKAVYTYPSRLMLIASMNPCPCGYFGSDSDARGCTCHIHKIEQYRARISGPLLDRIDLHVEIPRVDFGLLHQSAAGMSSAEMRERVLESRQIQKKRYAGLGISYNGELSGGLLRKFAALDPEAAELLRKTFDALGLSIRAHDRILKIARTIADLEGSEHVGVTQLAEAIQYRCLDRRAVG